MDRTIVLKFKETFHQYSVQKSFKYLIIRSNQRVFRFFLVCQFIFCFRISIFAQNPGDSVFSGIQVHTINLRFSQPNYWDSLTLYYNQGNEQLMPVSAAIDGVEYSKIGARLKGNSSYTYPNNKKSFKLNFDEYNSDLRWDNLKAIHLNNCWGDPTFMREKMYLDFCRDAGITAPRANFAKLYINDTLWGFYSMVEHVDKIFLKTRFGNKDGDLLKAGDAFDASGTALISDFCWYGKSDTSYTKRYELKTDGSTTAWPSLIALTDTLNNYPAIASVLPAKVNQNSLYKAITTDILFANLDSYINSGRNFYFYFLPKTVKMEWIIWDTGLSFGAYPAGISKMESLNVLYVINSADRPLVGKIFDTPELKTEFLKTFNSIFTTYFSPSRLFQHIDSIANTIRPSVNEDPRKMYTLQQFETNILNDVIAEGGGSGVSRKPGLKSFITARQTSVLSQLSNLGVTYVKTNETPETFSLTQNYPNPFNPATTIDFHVPVTCLVQLKVFDILGRNVKTLINELKQPGNYSINFNASSLSSGVYLYRLTANGIEYTRRMILNK